MDPRLERAVIVEARRTPIGRASKGALVGVRPDDMGGFIARSVLDMIGDGADSLVDELISGCGFPWGEQGYNVGRTIALLGGLPVETPGYTITRLCASSMQAVRSAQHAIALGEGTGYLVVGVESCSRVGRDRHLGERNPLLDPSSPGPTIADIYLSMIETAENVASQYGVTREAMDAFAMQSQTRAIAAQDSGYFSREIVPIALPGGGELSADEGPRRSTSAAKLAELAPIIPEKGGRVTAGNSCALNDGAVAVMVMAESKARALGLPIKARIVSSGVAGVDPTIMGVGPIEAVRTALKRAGMSLSDMDVVEINEAFASQVIAVAREIGLDPADERLNPHGGAIALGHPFGMSGARLITAAMHAMEESDGEFGLATLCVGGGQGQAMVLERVD